MILTLLSGLVAFYTQQILPLEPDLGDRNELPNQQLRRTRQPLSSVPLPV